MTLGVEEPQLSKPWNRWLWSPRVVTALLGASCFSKHFCCSNMTTPFWLCKPTGDEFSPGGALYLPKLGPLCLSRAQTGFTRRNELITQTTGKPGQKVVEESQLNISLHKLTELSSTPLTRCPYFFLGHWPAYSEANSYIAKSLRIECLGRWK